VDFSSSELVRAWKSIIGQKSGGLGTVAFGLQLFCAGLAVSALGVLAPVGLVMSFFGMTCCLAAPRESRCLGLVRASLVCYLAALALVLILFLFTYFSDGKGPIATLVVFSSPLFMVAAQILFLIGVRRLAEYVGQPRLSSGARSVLVAGLCFWAFVIGAVSLNPFGPLLVPIFGIAALGSAAILLRYAYIIFKLSDVLRKAAFEHGENRGVRPGQPEHAATDPGRNADIEKLLQRHDELP
jgi:hypothetical protein